MPSPELLHELRLIREELQYIREHMVDVDVLLSAEEEIVLAESLEEFKGGRTRSLEESKILVANIDARKKNV